MEQIKAVIFDFGGVIGLPQDRMMMKRMAQITGLSYDVFCERYYEHRLLYDKGIIQTKAYWKQITEGGKNSIDQATMDELHLLDCKSWTNINEKTIEFIHELKEKVEKVVLLSNINYGVLTYIQEKFSWLTLFDQHFYSCEMKMLKPSKEIYKALLKGIDLPAKQCLFFDDSKENIQGAVECGLQGIVFTNIEDVQALVKEKYIQ